MSDLGFDPRSDATLFDHSSDEEDMRYILRNATAVVQP